MLSIIICTILSVWLVLYGIKVTSDYNDLIYWSDINRDPIDRWFLNPLFKIFKVSLIIISVFFGIAFGLIVGNFIEPDLYSKKIEEEELVPIYYPIMEKPMAKYGYKTDYLYGVYVENVNYHYTDGKDEFNKSVVNNKIDLSSDYCYVTKQHYEHWMRYEGYKQLNTPQIYYHMDKKNIIITDCVYDYNHPRCEEYEYFLFNPEDKWNTRIQNWFTTKFSDYLIYHPHERFYYIPKNSIRNEFSILEKEMDK